MAFKIDLSGLKATVNDARDAQAGLPPGYTAFLERMKTGRAADMAEGEAFANKHFGEGNADMKAILDARKKAAFGADSAETDLLRAQGVQGINSQMATGMRSLRGLQGASGLRGGAALGQALPTLSQANIARGNLESDLAVNALRRRDSALNSYESSLTGERAGALGAQFGYAGLGAQDRANALQYGLGKGYLQAMMADLAAQQGGAPSDPGSAKNPYKWVPFHDDNTANQAWNQYIGNRTGIKGPMDDDNPINKAAGKYGPFHDDNPVNEAYRKYKPWNW